MVSRPAELDAVRAVLSTVQDPELPVDIVSLGMIAGAEIEADQSVTLRLVPTFLGCSAQFLIEQNVVDAIRDAGLGTARVVWDSADTWSVEKLAPPTRKVLAEHGIAVYDGGDLACPYCSASKTEFVSEVGSTLCRSLAYCHECMNPFEIFRDHRGGRLQSWVGSSGRAVPLRIRSAVAPKRTPT